jgi:hypothetical protein
MKMIQVSNQVETHTNNHIGNTTHAQQDCYTIAPIRHFPADPVTGCRLSTSERQTPFGCRIRPAWGIHQSETDVKDTCSPTRQNAVLE